jgi:2-(1,2-epoxy-1,2-dihydrophenyl)acetyl-CoA isomerase
MSDELLSRPDGAVHRLTINRPARRNALTPSLARALAQEIEQVEEAGDARAIILSGTGGHFCAGLDLHWLSSMRGGPSTLELQHGLSDFQSAVIAIVRCPVPVLAVVQGTAAGFGFDLALACDMRVAGSSATFISAFARMGLVPDGGSTFTLPRLVGVGRALRLLMTNQTLDAATALSIGLVEEVFEDAGLENGVSVMIGELLASADSSIRAIKRLCRAPEVGALEQALSSEGAAQLQALQAPEFLLRLEAFTVRASARAEGA